MKKLLLPPTAWLVLFMLVPMGLIAIFSLCGRSAHGGVEWRLSTEGVRALLDANTLALLWRSFWIAVVSTLLCLAASYPLAYFIATSRWKNALLVLVVIPFWTNFLVRTYALQFLLSPEGWLAQALGLDLLYHTPAVIFGLVYGYLPFMVLPIYASLEKVPKRLLEASQDLGAGLWRTFWRVTVPLTRPGIVAGCVLVFIPCLGAFVTPELLGGTRVTMIGSMINHHFKSSGDWPRGSALALVVTLLMATMLYLYYRLRRTEELA